jgi:hypothetical protein
VTLTLAELRDNIDTPGGGIESVYYCPLCSCQKSGDPAEPNGHNDCCSNENCPCHQEEPTQ